MDLVIPSFPDTAARLDQAARHIVSTTAGRRMVWRVWGEGPPLILFHGGHGSWLHWVRNIEALSDRHRLILPDLPGFGDSDPLAERTIEALRAALVAGFAALDLPESFHLGGFSFGCVPACHLLPDVGRRLHRLFLFGSGGLGRFNSVTDRLRRWQETPAGPARDAINRHNLAVLMLHDPDRIDSLAVRIQSTNTARTLDNMRGIAAGSDLRASVAASPCPVLCAYGDHDTLAHGYFAERREFIEALSVPSRFELIPDAGHWVQYEAPEAVNHVILAAMAEDLRKGAEGVTR